MHNRQSFLEQTVAVKIKARMTYVMWRRTHLERQCAPQSTPVHLVSPNNVG
jgi:hypothetical protein